MTSPSGPGDAFPRPGYSLQVKIMFFVGVAILLTVGLSSALYLQNFRANYLEALEWRSVTLAQSISVDIHSRYDLYGGLADSRLLLESAFLQCRKLYNANRSMHVSFVAILDEQGNIITHNDKAYWGGRYDFGDVGIWKQLQDGETVTRLLGEQYHTLIPVIADGATAPKAGSEVLLGIVDVGFPRNVVDEKVADYLKTAALLFSFLFLSIFGLVWLFFRRLVAIPVLELIRRTADIAAGNLKRDMFVDRSREFWELSRSLTHMRDSIRRSMDGIEQKNQEIKALTSCSPVALFSVDLLGNVAIWTESAERLFGWKADEILGFPPPNVPEDELGGFAAICTEVRKGKVIFGREIGQQCRDESRFPGSLSSAPVRDADGAIVGVMGAIEDISERVEREKEHREVEEQLTQAQKMESVGRLAGGVAHDYNNMLGVILGYSELMQEQLGPDDPKSGYLEEIIKATNHSKDITRQLLAFARKQTIAPVVLNLNEQIEQLLKMLGRLLGEDIELIWLPGEGGLTVKMDPGQIDQMLVNLCINSRDAMPDGGEITIETREVMVDDDYCRNHPEFKPGAFVCLSISDNGIGMDKETRTRIFDPFFTTKDVGKGTGLGLATVYGIVKQNDGFLNVYSEPEKGTTFNIYLTRHNLAADLSVRQPASAAALEGNGELVLVVEDEKAILGMCRQMLRSLGYQVLGVDTTAEALELVAEHRENLRLLLTDVILRDMNGRELSAQVQQICPGLKTLYMSGYTANVIAHRGVLDEGIHFIQKPFSTHDLALKVREALQE